MINNAKKTRKTSRVKDILHKDYEAITLPYILTLSNLMPTHLAAAGRLVIQTEPPNAGEVVQPSPRDLLVDRPKLGPHQSVVVMSGAASPGIFLVGAVAADGPHVIEFLRFRVDAPVPVGFLLQRFHNLHDETDRAKVRQTG